MADDCITLKALKYHAKHGYYEHERESGNRFEVDLVARGDFKKSIEGDNLSGTFDYEKAENVVRGVMEGVSQKLIETLCSDIGNALFNEFQNINKLEVAIRKMNPPIKTDADYAEIRMRWNR